MLRKISLFRGLERFKTSRGYGVHSPFAFNLITNVIYSPYSYYALQDVNNFVSQRKNFNLVNHARYNEIALRLVSYFRPKHVLVANPQHGLDSLYVSSANSAFEQLVLLGESISMQADIVRIYKSYYSGRNNYTPTYEDIASKLLITDSTSCIKSYKYDAVFVCGKGLNVRADELLDISKDKTIIMINNINSGCNKQLWKNIVDSSNIGFVFDMKHFGVAFVMPTYYKSYYYI
ncbi:MAG: hypothetical protein ACOYEA_03685 [Fermentimonas sp.]